MATKNFTAGSTWTKITDAGSTAEDVEQSWNYQVAKVLVDSSRNEKIEAVMATRYPTYGSELAAVNNGGQDYEDYLEFRNEAKRLVDSFEGY